MKPGGAMYPSHARMFMAPIHTEVGTRRNSEFQVRARAPFGAGLPTGPAGAAGSRTRSCALVSSCAAHARSSPLPGP
jgi:hypothetical protein